ncbi:transposase, partial [Paludibacterium sp.]|nr:transposase [Paludibacterium sp.]
MDTLHLPEAGRRRRRYSAEFKSDIVAACLQPGVSTTAIALAN